MKTGLRKKLIKIGLLHLSLGVLCTRPTREHHKPTVIARVSGFFCNTSLRDFSQVRKKKLSTRF